MDFRTDVVIVGTGVAGTFSALNLPKDKNIIMITKSDLESSDSFLAQGGICVLTDENDYDNYFSTDGRKRNVISPVCQKFIPVRPLAARLSEPPF